MGEEFYCHFAGHSPWRCLGRRQSFIYLIILSWELAGRISPTNEIKLVGSFLLRSSLIQRGVKDGVLQRLILGTAVIYLQDPLPNSLGPASFGNGELENVNSSI